MLPESIIWGALPSGFIKLTDGNGNRMLVRQERQREIGFDICLDHRRQGETSAYHGRSSLTALRLSDGETALVRQYHHGGIFRGLTRSWFCTWPPRPFRELTVTEELRRRGLLTVEVYAACVSRSYGPFYQGWFVTRELHGAVDLWSALRQGMVDRWGTETVWRTVAKSLRILHREGVYHGDLNLKNILLREEPAGVVSYLIDFDKATLVLGRLSDRLAKKNLDRLLRSARKLDGERRYISEASWQKFVDMYHGNVED